MDKNHLLRNFLNFWISNNSTETCPENIEGLSNACCGSETCHDCKIQSLKEVEIDVDSILGEGEST